MTDRQRWAVELVAASTPGTVLEIGCGPGAALALLTEVLPGARLVGVDRSATAVRRAAARLAEVPGGSRVALQQVAVAELDLPDASVDVVLGVNVNVFWTSAATRELAVLARLLRPGGVLHLVYEPPGEDPWVVDGVTASLDKAGWSHQVKRRTSLTVRNAAPARRRLVAVSAVPGA